VRDRDDIGLGTLLMRLERAGVGAGSTIRSDVPGGRRSPADAD
jgi:hypothetical protein